MLGFCFSFAVQQTGLASGRLLDWTKGFSCSGCIGNDPVAMLSAALERAGRPCRIAALLNDTVRAKRGIHIHDLAPTLCCAHAASASTRAKTRVHCVVHKWLSH